MKTSSRKRNRESRPSTDTHLPELLSQMETRLYRCVERIHELEQQNTEYEIYYEKHKHGIEQSRQQIVKQLEQKEQILESLRQTLAGRENQIQDLKNILRQKEQNLQKLSQEFEQLKQELQQTQRIIPATTDPTDESETMERIRERIRHVLYKLDQLERMVSMPSITHNP